MPKQDFGLRPCQRLSFCATPLLCHADLEEIGDLEGYIDRTSTILICALFQLTKHLAFGAILNVAYVGVCPTSRCSLRRLLQGLLHLKKLHA